MNIGDRIKEVRLRSGLTQEALASQMGIAKTTLTGYEKGYRDPKSDKLAKIAIICDTTVDYLLGQTHEIRKPVMTDILYISRPTGDESTDELRKRLHDLIDQLDDEDLRLLSDLTIRFKKD